MHVDTDRLTHDEISPDNWDEQNLRKIATFDYFIVLRMLVVSTEYIF